MKVITCTGYYGTGSSAITDLMKEYSNVSCKTDFEVSFIYQPGGINTLYYHLIENPTKQSSAAINHFSKWCEKAAVEGSKMNYQKYFDGVFLEYTRDYIREIGGKYYTSEDYGAFLTKPFLYRLLFKAITKLHHIRYKDTCRVYTGCPRIPYYFYDKDEKQFIERTKRYLNRLFEAISYDKEYVMVDQLVSSSCIDNCTRYFDNIYVIIVDRDPRDIYLSIKYIWKSDFKEFAEDISLFCLWYKWSRSLDSKEDQKYLHIQFEDMLWNYEETIRKIENYCGLNSNEHTKKFQCFNPEISEKNCRLWKLYPEESENMRYIEKNLKEYLYGE